LADLIAFIRMYKPDGSLPKVRDLAYVPCSHQLNALMQPVLELFEKLPTLPDLHEKLQIFQRHKLDERHEQGTDHYAIPLPRA
jgi:hypothetical protein